MPRSRLGGCLEGELTLACEPGVLPQGFIASGNRGQPVRCTLGPRLVRVIATLFGGDEWVVYTAAMGKPVALEPRLFSVPLVAPDSLVTQNFAPWPRTGDVVTPASILPLSGVSRIYGNSGSVGLGGGGTWNIPADSYTPLTTYEAWWRLALQAEPMGEFGVGPDLAFLGGVPNGVASPAVYPLDSRAQAFKSAGRQIPPYLTKIRKWIKGSPEFQPPHTENSRTPAQSMFVPTRTAGVGGTITTSVTSVPVTLSSSGGGSVDVSGLNQTNQQLQCTIPVIAGRVQDVDMVAHLAITGVTGEVAVYMLAQAHLRTGGFGVLHQDLKKAIAGSYDLQVKVDAKSLEGVDYITYIVGLQGLAAGASASGVLSAGPASMRYEYTSYSVGFEGEPPGLGYPTETDEAHSFWLPGLHAGPLLTTELPGGLQQYTSMVMNCTPDGGIWSDAQSGPLPYQNSPVDPRTGRWRG